MLNLSLIENPKRNGMDTSKLWLFSLLFISTLQAQDIQPFASAIWMSGEGFKTQFYNITSTEIEGYDAQKNAIEQGEGKWDAPGVYFRGFDFGKHISKSGTLKFGGAEIKVVKKSADQNVCDISLDYRVNDLTNRILGKYYNHSLLFVTHCSGAVGTNVFDDGYGYCVTSSKNPKESKWEKFQEVSLNEDLTHRNEGKYELELFMTVSGSIVGTKTCKVIDSNANMTEDMTHKALFTICPKYISHSVNKELKTISIELVGVADGVYTNQFFYGENEVFKRVVVKNGKATIKVEGESYKNIRYQNIEGCDAVGNFDVEF